MPSASPAGPSKRTRAGAAIRYATAAAAAIVLVSLGSLSARQPAPMLPPAAMRAVELGWLQWERRDPENLAIAQRHFALTIRLAPNDARGYAGMAAVAGIRADRAKPGTEQRHWLREALDYASKALARDPHNADAVDVRGLVALEKNDWRAADGIFRQAQALDEGNPYAHIWRGMALMDEGRLDEGRREFVRGEELDPQSKIAASWLGTALYNERAYDAAAEQFRSVLELDPRDAGAIVELARIDEVHRDYDRALARLRSPAARIPAEERDPMVARLDALRGRVTQARREFAAVSRRAAKHADPLEIAATQLVLGDRGAALATLKKLSTSSKYHEVNRSLEWDVRFDALRHLALENHVAQTD